MLCLAPAGQLAGASGDGWKAIAIGAADGIYVVPAKLDVSWRADVERVGVEVHELLKERTAGKAPYCHFQPMGHRRPGHFEVLHFPDVTQLMLGS